MGFHYGEYCMRFLHLGSYNIFFYNGTKELNTSCALLGSLTRETSETSCLKGSEISNTCPRNTVLLTLTNLCCFEASWGQHWRDLPTEEHEKGMECCHGECDTN